MKHHSLSFKINLTILITATVISVLFTSVLYPLERRRYNIQIHRIHLLIETVFKQEQNDLANELYARQHRAIEASLKQITAVKGIVGVRVYLPDGRLFASTDENRSERLPDVDVLKPGRDSGTFERILANGWNLGVYTSVIEVIGQKTGFIAIYYDFSALEHEVRISMLIFPGVLVAIILLMSVLLNVMLSRFVTDPVSALRNAMRRVADGRLGETVSVTRRDEIGEMGAVFNEMSIKLRQSQQDLVMAEEKYRSIFENATEGIFQSTPGNGRFLTVNPAMASMLGYGSPEELIASVTNIGKQVFVRDDNARRFDQTILTQDRVMGFETQLRQKNGDAIWVSIAARAVTDDSGVLSYCEGSLTDITERRKRALAESKREAAEAASRTKSAFLANMSHEIRTPINAILGFADLLFSQEPDPNHRVYLESIRSSGKALMSLINDILDLSKVEAGKLEIQSRSTRLKSLFSEIEQSFSLTMERKKVRFSAHLDPAIPEYLLLDDTRLRQILNNLIGNAVKFTVSGSIGLTAVRSDSGNDASVDLAISVTDSGVGIAPEAHQRIFDAFIQQSDPSALSHEGTGLGLAISKNLTELMGGSIAVDSAVGKGSTFTIRLPAVPVDRTIAREPRSDMEAAAVGLKGRTVLVVDDLNVNRRLIKEILQGVGVTAIEAWDGQAGIESVGRHRPDAVLMDIRMPGMDGYEAARRIRRLPGGESIPIIAITAGGMKEDMQRLMQGEFDRYLIRPFSPSDLLATLSSEIANAERLPSTTESTETGTMETSDALIAEGPKILNALETEAMPRWEAVSRRQQINEIENFAKDIQSIGRHYGITALTEYGERLLFHAGGFDVDNIRITLSRYPSLVADIKQKVVSIPGSGVDAKVMP